MVDVSGKKVSKSDAQQDHVVLDISALEKGMYLLTVYDKDKSLKTFRVMIK
jgi:hypothetical protein